MNFPADQIFGSPSFHYKVEKEGEAYKCTNVSLDGKVAPVVRASEREAIDAARQATEAYIGKGGK